MPSIHPDIERVLISEEALQQRITALGAQISADYAGKTIHMIGVLKGAVLFMADLARTITVPVTLDFMATASYGDQTQTSGIVRFLKDLDEPIADKDIVLVEDIIDSGLTLKYLIESLRRRNPASLRVCTLLDKATARQADIHVDYAGFTVPNEFVVGYGLDYAQHYRNLPYIGVLRPEVYAQPQHQ